MTIVTIQNKVDESVDKYIMLIFFFICLLDLNYQKTSKYEPRKKLVTRKDRVRI